MRRLTESECLEIGGHCWEMSQLVFAVLPPAYRRICKHCGKVQEGSPREQFDWSDR